MDNYYMLTKEQLNIVDYQLCDPKSTIYNSYAILEIDTNEYNMEKLAKSIYETIKSHKSLLTTYSINESGDIVQKYTPDLLDEIKVEKISDFDFNQIKENLVMPFKLIDSKMYRCRVFKTEKNGYIFIDVHNSLFDEKSFTIFINDVFKKYADNELEQDNYFTMLDEYTKKEESELYKEASEYFERKYNRDEWITKLSVDHNSKKIGKSVSKSILDVEDDRLVEIEDKYNISRNEFLLTAFLLATSIYNNKDNIKISWIHNERETEKYENTVGFLHRKLPVALKFDNNITMCEIYKDVHEQVNNGVKYSNSCLDDNDDATYFMYKNNDRLFNTKYKIIDIKQNQYLSKSILNFQIIDNKNGLEVVIEYSSSKYNDDSINNFIELLTNVINTIVNSEDELIVNDIKSKVKSNNNIINKVVNIFK